MKLATVDIAAEYMSGANSDTTASHLPPALDRPFFTMGSDDCKRTLTHISMTFLGVSFGQCRTRGLHDTHPPQVRAAIRQKGIPAFVELRTGPWETLHK